MQAVNVGLWGWRTNISLSFNSGEWGQVSWEASGAESWRTSALRAKHSAVSPVPLAQPLQVFRESKPGEAGMPALSVKDIAAMFNIPRFDFVKIDIGASTLPALLSSVGSAEVVAILMSAHATILPQRVPRALCSPQRRTSAGLLTPRW